VAQDQQFVSPDGERVFPFNPKYLREVTPNADCASEAVAVKPLGRSRHPEP
jgi:hypothetical protein